MTGALLYFSCVFDNKLLVVLVTIETQDHSSTESTSTEIDHLLD